MVKIVKWIFFCFVAVAALFVPRKKKHKQDIKTETEKEKEYLDKIEPSMTL